MLRRLALSTTLLLAATTALSQEDVDLADSLNFEEFHKDKKEAVKVFEKKDETQKVYKDDTPNTVKTETLPSPSANAAASTVTAEAAAEPGKRFEIRERYTLGRSNKTPYSAFYVIEAMHKQMAEICPNGWNKLKEFSKPVEQDFYLHYEFECL